MRIRYPNTPNEQPPLALANKTITKNSFHETTGGNIYLLGCGCDGNQFAEYATSLDWKSIAVHWALAFWKWLIWFVQSAWIAHPPNTPAKNLGISLSYDNWKLGQWLPQSPESSESVSSSIPTRSFFAHGSPSESVRSDSATCLLCMPCYVHHSLGHEEPFSYWGIFLGSQWTPHTVRWTWSW